MVGTATNDNDRRCNRQECVQPPTDEHVIVMYGYLYTHTASHKHTTRTDTSGVHTNHHENKRTTIDNVLRTVGYVHIRIHTTIVDGYMKDGCSPTHNVHWIPNIDIANTRKVVDALCGTCTIMIVS